ncbi:MAG: preprotein translocase subunit SecG [Ruminococcaceae bacterium]|nr:preprotein translocase subunit SecG [Oscillospiraceae bacterium]
MNPIIYVLGSVLIAMAIFLVIAVLMQSGKDKKLSGSIAGGADTYFGKTKARSWDKILSLVTTIIAILFVALVIVLYVLVARAF